MANSIHKFEDFKKLTRAERDFFIYMQVVNLDRKFASKIVERIVFGFIALILIAVASAFINLVVIQALKQ